jgi:hypothetical protein
VQKIAYAFGMKSGDGLIVLKPYALSNIKGFGFQKSKFPARTIGNKCLWLYHVACRDNKFSYTWYSGTMEG